MNRNNPLISSALSSQKEMVNRDNFVELYKKCPLPDQERLENLPLFLKRQELSRVLFIQELYKRIIDVHGIIIEFGVRWGANLALFEGFRGIHEPFNYNRKIVGFDTFEGFPTTHAKDGTADFVQPGAYSVTPRYEEYLEAVMNCHEQESPIPHIRKFELRKGDATVEIKKYLQENPETIIALAYFDFDLYEPTKVCLEAISGHLSKGAVLGFDELNHHGFPGETAAFKEVFGLNRFKINRLPCCPLQSFVVFE